MLLQHQLQQTYNQLKAGEPIDWQAFLAEAVTHQLEGMSEAELVALLQKDEDWQDETEDIVPFHSSAGTFDTHQPAKPRKTPLQLAAELPDRKNKPSNKKKQR